MEVRKEEAISLEASCTVVEYISGYVAGVCVCVFLVIENTAYM